MVTRQRSPNYPGIDLEAAIEAAGSVYQKLGRAQFNLDEAANTWGYRGPSGPVRVRLAALRQYGLLDGQRGENPKLSRRALTFVLRNQSSREYKNALQEAALAPVLFREIGDARPDASDGVLREYLIVDRNFTDDGAERAIAVYRTTMRLASLETEDTISRLEEDESWHESEDDVSSVPTAESMPPATNPPVTNPPVTNPPVTNPPVTNPPVTNPPVTNPPVTNTAPMSLSEDHTRVPLRLMGGSLIAAVELPSAMTEAAWQQMITMLNALKPGYVAPNGPERPDREPEPSDA